MEESDYFIVDNYYFDDHSAGIRNRIKEHKVLRDVSGRSGYGVGFAALYYNNIVKRYPGFWVTQPFRLYS